MKNFNFNRFKKVVARDFHNTYALFGMSMLIIMLLPLLFWLFAVAVQDDVVESFNRLNFIQLSVYITAAISSMKIYNSCNLVGKGNYFAMLPASLCEKFTSMMLYCFIVCPLAVFVGAFTVDTLLTLLPFGPYKEFLWQLPDWMLSSKGIFFPVYAMNFTGFVLIAMKVFATASLFMLANTIFKKNKFLKTILWLVIIFFVACLIFIPVMNHINWDQEWLYRIVKWLNVKSEAQLIRLFFWSQFLFDAVLTFVFSFITYRRLKKMQY